MTATVEQPKITRRCFAIVETKGMLKKGCKNEKYGKPCSIFCRIPACVNTDKNLQYVKVKLQAKDLNLVHFFTRATFSFQLSC